MGCEGKRLKGELGGCLRERDAVRMVSDDAMENLGGRTGGKSDATWPCRVGRGGWRGAWKVLTPFSYFRSPSHKWASVGALG